MGNEECGIRRAPDFNRGYKMKYVKNFFQLKLGAKLMGNDVCGIRITPDFNRGYKILQ